MSATERDSFSNLLLLCHPHHGEVDNDEERYPPPTLKKWKSKHDGPEVAELYSLRFTSPDMLMDLLTQIASPPLDRLEAITERLEQTGEATQETVAELRYVVDRLSESDAGIDARSARSLADSADVLSSVNLSRSALALASACEVLPAVLPRIEKAVKQLRQFE